VGSSASEQGGTRLGAVTGEQSPAHPLARAGGETHEQHRGFLLYAAQDPDKRSRRQVARAMGRDESSVRYWAGRNQWEERLQAAGPGGQSQALARYFALQNWSRLEIEAVRARISLPLVADDPQAPTPPPESVVEGRHDARLGGTPRAGTEAQRGHPSAAQRAATSPDAETQLLQRAASLLDGTLARFSQALVSSNPPKVAPRDVPALLEARRKIGRDLAAREAGESTGGERVEVHESYRVRQARADGGDVLAAAAEDARDLAAIFAAMSRQEQSDQEVQRRAAGEG